MYVAGGTDVIDLSDAQLAQADLTGADMGAAILNRADLSEAILVCADMRQALCIQTNLARAELGGAKLGQVNLDKANLTAADLVWVDMTQAHLNRTNLTNARLGWCSLDDLSLAAIEGIGTVKHDGPSHVSIATLERTAAELVHESSVQINEVEVFLENAGVRKDYIEFFRSRIGQPIQFYSVFISYSTKDQEFADRLYADLNQKAIRCWLATEDLKIGDKFRARINEAIYIHDKLLLILSETSIQSAWVDAEVEAALEKEIKTGTIVLFPVRLDDAVMDTQQAWAEHIRQTRHIGDFRQWKDHDEYQKALARLIRDLQATSEVKSPPE
jgi:hypothetical protein